MGFLRRLFSPARKMTSLDLFRQIYGGRESSAGVVVNVDTALQVTTVLACCRVIAEGVAQVPFRVYRERGDGGRSPAPDHGLDHILARRPNRWQTSFEFRETLIFHMALTGNAFVFVNRVGTRREVRELVPIEPGLVSVERQPDQTLLYKVTPKDAPARVFTQETIWHLRGPSWNSWMGMEPVRLARNAIGLSIALEESHSSLHRNGGQISGLLSFEGNMTPEKYAELAQWLDEYAIGGKRHGKPMVLDRKAKFMPMVMKGVDAQHLETRKHQIEEICRGMRVMPIMVGLADKTATYASSEQMFLAHRIHTLGPWYERLENSADNALLSDDDRRTGYFTRFVPNGLMRGSMKDRAEYFSKALGSGGHNTAWLTQNEVRIEEDRQPIADPAYDRLPVGNPKPSTPDDGGPDDDGNDPDDREKENDT